MQSRSPLIQLDPNDLTEENSLLLNELINRYLIKAGKVKLPPGLYTLSYESANGEISDIQVNLTHGICYETIVNDYEQANTLLLDLKNQIAKNLQLFAREKDKFSSEKKQLQKFKEELENLMRKPSQLNDQAQLTDFIAMNESFKKRSAEFYSGMLHFGNDIYPSSIKNYNKIMNQLKPNNGNDNLNRLKNSIQGAIKSYLHQTKTISEAHFRNIEEIIKLINYSNMHASEDELIKSVKDKLNTFKVGLLDGSQLFDSINGVLSKARIDATFFSSKYESTAKEKKIERRQFKPKR